MIAEKNVPLEGEILLYEGGAENECIGCNHRYSVGDPLHCPICDHHETRMFHEIGGVETERTSDRGDTQPWTHIIKVQCMSCDWKHVVANEVCVGDPWDDVMGFNRHLDQNQEQKHAITWTNEQAVGLRGARQKYNKKDRLYKKSHRHKREVHTEKSDGPSKVEWKPTAEERSLPRFAPKEE
jgi:hypothetical protein